MSKVVEIIKAFVSPCEKLISLTQTVFGKAYEPRYVKRMADAKAYEIRQISQAVAESIDVPIIYNKGDISMDTTDFDELVKRAQNRLAYQELRKQSNIEAVIANAYIILEHEPPVSSDPADPDWVFRFFNSVEDISNEQMQYLWGKILAGEIKQPNSFSLRTLSILKNLTQREANLFVSVAPYILTCPGNDEKSIVDYFIPSPSMIGLSKNPLEKYSIPFPDILTLSEAGIINHTSNISIYLHLNPNETGRIIGTQGYIDCYNGSAKTVDLIHDAHVLTESGKELYPIIISECPDSAPNEYISTFMKSLIAINHLNTVEEKKNIKVSIVEN